MAKYVEMEIENVNYTIRKNYWPYIAKCLLISSFVVLLFMTSIQLYFYFGVLVSLNNEYLPIIDNYISKIDEYIEIIDEHIPIISKVDDIVSTANTIMIKNKDIITFIEYLNQTEVLEMYSQLKNFLNEVCTQYIECT